MLQLPDGRVTITRIGPNHEVITVLTNAPASLDGDKNGAMISPPWYQSGFDSELGGVQVAEWSLMIGGPDENPDYEPRPGDRIVFTPNKAASKRAGVYRQVAASTGEEDAAGLLDYWDLPVCKARST